MILLNAGIRIRYALSIAILTYIASFLGAYVGVALGQELNIVEWIFGITAGMFLYIALVELVSMSSQCVISMLFQKLFLSYFFPIKWSRYPNLTATGT